MDSWCQIISLDKPLCFATICIMQALTPHDIYDTNNWVIKNSTIFLLHCCFSSGDILGWSQYQCYWLDIFNIFQFSIVRKSIYFPFLNAIIYFFDNTPIFRNGTYFIVILREIWIDKCTSKNICSGNLVWSCVVFSNRLKDSHIYTICN